jgi:hypothetical protein
MAFIEGNLALVTASTCASSEAEPWIWGIRPCSFGTPAVDEEFPFEVIQGDIRTS